MRISAYPAIAVALPHLQLLLLSCIYARQFEGLDMCRCEGEI